MTEDLSILDAPQVDTNQSIVKEIPKTDAEIEEPKQKKPRKKRATKKAKETEQKKTQQHQMNKLMIQLMKVKFEDRLKDIDISKIESMNDDELELLKNSCKIRLTSGSNVDITVNSVLMSMKLIEEACISYNIPMQGFYNNITNNQQINDDLTLLAIELIERFNIDYRYRLLYNIIRTGIATKQINEYQIQKQNLDIQNQQ